MFQVNDLRISAWRQRLVESLIIRCSKVQTNTPLTRRLTARRQSVCVCINGDVFGKRFAISVTGWYMMGYKKLSCRREIARRFVST